ncbi:hypothetical protein ACUY3K_02640 [Corynebacterium uberis]|uniref:hypothetical protein n=1 Tax=Corynebacterium TaxID=1716 RepID=UPI001D0A9AB7|nr:MULTISPECIES: hypothetical protein [Corynebacterium]MCZ9309876.1 hypothetical protein [Corynebacterium sp. c6VSa_13]UDL73200.1 hypothetical protein LH391_08845 [Corynebacterium uberis]UDL75923.1 hypothetical protein LH393_00545 [Corynebacterium uberis]UDL78135.1 hypothetical protein LH394_00540 [Corynebacterium uberis]UDL80418.1 hypothetical protein LH392_00970 [Corynebacterium uberis]
MIAVVDGPVIWHVQTTGIDAGILTGAWITEDPAVADSLLADAAAVIHPGDGTVERITATIEEALADYTRVDAEARFAALDAPDTAELTQAYTGEPIAAQAWACATALASLISQWASYESARRARKKLQEAYGTEARELPYTPPSD